MAARIPATLVGKVMWPGLPFGARAWLRMARPSVKDLLNSHLNELFDELLGERLVD